MNENDPSNFWFWCTFFIYLMAGLFFFFSLTKYEFNGRRGYVRHIGLVLFPVCLFAWPVMGVWNTLVRE